MVWAWFSNLGKIKLVFVENTISAVRYTEVLSEEVALHRRTPSGTLRFSIRLCLEPLRSTYQGVAHGQCRQRNQLGGSFAKLEPNREPVGILSQEIYANGRQFDYDDDLREAIVAAWDKIRWRP